MWDYKKIFFSFNNKSIWFKVVCYFLVLMFISFLSIGLLINFIFSNAMGNAASNATMQSINQVNITVDNHIKNIENIINLIQSNTQVMDFLRSDIQAGLMQESADRSNIRSFLANIAQYNPSIQGIAIISKNDNLLSNEMYRVMDEPLNEESWYKNCEQMQDQIYLIGRPINRNLSHYKNISADEIISVMKSVVEPSNGEVIGVIIIDISLTVLEDTLKNSKLGKVGFVYIVDSKGEVIYSPVNSIVPRIKDQWFSGRASAIFNKKILGQQFQFIYAMSVYTKWKIVGVFSLNETLREVVNFRYYLVIVLLILSLIAIGVSLFFSSTIIQPLRELQKLMKKTESGNFSVNFNVKYNDEIGQLGRSFNTMISEIKKLIEMVYKEQRSKRQAELITLQAQIKPHFLYNTFETLHWMAKKYGANDIIQLINALTSLFRLGLSKGSEIIGVLDEIEHVRNYLLIQKIRYEDMLDYEIEVSENVRPFYVLKLILQPIVENAIYHGIKNKSVPGKIIVKAEIEDNCLLFTVNDNGAGIPSDKLQSINQSLKMDNGERLGFGIFNVNERIRLSYGKEYGLSISSTEGIGTTVTIKLPCYIKTKG